MAKEPEETNEPQPEPDPQLNTEAYTDPTDAQDDEYQFDDLMALYERDYEGLDRLKLSHTSPHELGQFLARLDPEEQNGFLRKISDRTAGEILTEMDSEDSAEVLVQMKDFRALRILENLEPDDAAYIVRQLETEDRDRLLGKLPLENARTIYELLSYDADSAGGVMTPRVNRVRSDSTVDQAIQMIRMNGDENENLDTIYVTDYEGRLQGTITLHRLIRAKGTETVEQIMDPNLQGACRADEPTSEVAKAMAEFDMQNVPVIDSQNRLIGMITHDDVIDILQESATKDIQILHGAGADENIHDPVTYSVIKRNPWLIVNMLTASLGAIVVSRFQDQISQLALLAVFMTMITSLGGNAGGQTLAVAIRSLALGEWHRGDTLSICLKEILKGLLNGLLIGTISSVVCTIITGNSLVGLAIFLTMIFNMGICCLSGALIPYVLRKLNFDPAQSAYIFLTMVTDTLGMYIFLMLSSWLLFKM